jgi:hypothetical protein
MPILVEDMSLDTTGTEEPKKRGGGGDSSAGAGSEPPKPEEIEHALRQQLERAERIRAY